MVGEGDLGIVEIHEVLVGLWSPRNLTERQAADVLERPCIGVADPGCKLTAKALGRVVRRVRIDRMNVEKEGSFLAISVQPVEDLLIDAIGTCRLEIELIEALLQP